jgi:hypothetical protein
MARRGASAPRLFGRGAQGLASIPLKAREAVELTRRNDVGRAPIATDRIDELETLMAMADVIGVPPAETALPRAGLLSRRGGFEPALAVDNPALAADTEAAPDGRMRAAPIGDYRTVFAAFTQMNALSGAPLAEAARMRERHGNIIARLVRTTTPKWYDNWTAAALSPQRPPPIFPFARRSSPPGEALWVRKPDLSAHSHHPQAEREVANDPRMQMESSGGPLKRASPTSK